MFRTFGGRCASARGGAGYYQSRLSYQLELYSSRSFVTHTNIFLPLVSQDGAADIFTRIARVVDLYPLSLAPCRWTIVPKVQTTFVEFIVAIVLTSKSNQWIEL